jgi:hypothetical protein
MTGPGDTADQPGRAGEPRLTPARRAARAAREARLARALRDNLKRRKAQARAQKHDAEADEPRG